MNIQAEKFNAVSASLNFAADRGNGGIWSNSDRGLITQALRAHEVDIVDARTLPGPTSFSEQGFEVHHDPLQNAAWADRDWCVSVYNPHCLALVKRVTGAAAVATYFGGGALIRDTGDVTRAAAAEFVHLDQTRESAIEFLKGSTDQPPPGKYPHVKIFNVWRPITPPPQDVPLALCDQRRLDESDWVTGRTVEPSFPNGVPYLTSVYNPQQQWYFFSDLMPDNAVIFKGYDSDPRAPMGCLHGAFKDTTLQTATIPRASVETRIFAFFDE